MGMATMGTREADASMEDDYNESDDSDFVGDAGEDGVLSDPDSEDAADSAFTARPTKRRKVQKKISTQNYDDLGELDSGDEATIRERARANRKAKKTGDTAVEMNSDGEDQQSWGAKTRSMRDKESEQPKKKTKLATTEGSTFDVDAVWAEMNRPGNTCGLLHKPSTTEEKAEESTKNAQSHQASDPIDTSAGTTEQKAVEDTKNAQSHQASDPIDTSAVAEEMISIKKTYNFAGQQHTEEKVVLKSSPEARLWLEEQAADSKKGAADSTVPPNHNRPINRPLRFISRFDPNRHNLEAFKRPFDRHGRLLTNTAPPPVPKPNTIEKKGLKADTVEKDVPKLNVVEKSKMDWVAHVDKEGLKEELDVAARAKEGYHGRMDFLNEVEARKAEEARQARVKGK